MKIISWNVNWLRSIIQKWFINFIKQEQPDILWLQETKIKDYQIDMFFLDEIHRLWYFTYFNSSKKWWYSWTAIFTKYKPLQVYKWIKINEKFIYNFTNFSEEIQNIIFKDNEWRVITLEYNNFYFITVYTPNSKHDLSRLNFRKIWDKAVLEYLKKLNENKPVIFSWDLNVAHKEIDLAEPEKYKQTPWFTNEERYWFENYLQNWFIDTFRHMYPNKQWAYSFWFYFWKNREKNLWWRIDYILISKKLKTNLIDSLILSDIKWSDHCPVWILLS